MQYRTDGKPAPGQLELLHGFLNTHSDELHIEDLADAQATLQWLHAAGLGVEMRTLTEGDVRLLTTFREDLRAAVLAGLSGDEEAPGATARLFERYLVNVSYRLQAADNTTHIVCNEGGVEGVIGTLLAIVHNSMLQGTWSRFKCCQLPSCGWAFYDYSKNHSGRWCSMKTCGSRHKARTYLQRKSAQS